jgi:hypothetical protein
MKKLEKRQIIILVIAALCVLYAAYEFLIAKPAAKKAPVQVAPVAESLNSNTRTGDLTSYQVSKVDLYIKEKAERDWSKSPFWETTAYREFVGKEAGVGAVQATKFIYSGYIDAGHKKIAIINGAEYGAGESLELKDQMLKSVTNAKVIIVNRKTGIEIQVPLEE